MKLKLFFVFTLLLLVGAGYVCIRYYSYVFAKVVRGEVIGIDRVNQSTAIISGSNPANRADLFSFAVAIRDEKGEITTSSTEDRQWAVVQKGHCAEAKFFPYPPWEFEKAGTYFNARLLRLYDCGKGGAPVSSPSPPAAPVPSPSEAE